VALTSVPIVLAGGILFFVLLFAGLSWGEQGILTARILQAISFVIVVLQIIGLIAVFISQRKRQDRDSTASS
jgi:malonyl CoA-acyl carrier protein transacylase